jgi:anti-anti-sigma regulatory factor
MACNFRILFHQNSESIHLKLTGDFDGSSAHELLNTIKTCSRNVNRIFIHTDGLKDVHPFGRAVFHKNFQELNKPDTKFIFTGENGDTLSQ